MDQPDNLSQSNIAIIGLGLMGGSLAMALRGHCAFLSGSDLDLGTNQYALDKKIVDQASEDPANILPQADIIILALPVGAIIDLISRLPNLHPGSPVVIDIGSTKMQINQAFQNLPVRFDPIGGHPMCGKEILSIANADPTIFLGAPFAFTPLVRTSPRAVRIAEELASVLGARPLWIDPQTHDRWTAATSHMPYLISSALAAATQLETAPLIGSGFQSATRLAATPFSMMMDVLNTNQENISNALAAFREQLDLIEEYLNTGQTIKLAELLNHTKNHRRTLLDSSRKQGDLP
jgi:prephenate dehydrogenase